MKKIANLENILKSLSEKSYIREDENYILRNMSETSAEIAKREITQSKTNKKVNIVPV